MKRYKNLFGFMRECKYGNWVKLSDHCDALNGLRERHSNELAKLRGNHDKLQIDRVKLKDDNAAMDETINNYNQVLVTQRDTIRRLIEESSNRPDEIEKLNLSIAEREEKIEALKTESFALIVVYVVTLFLIGVML